MELVCYYYTITITIYVIEIFGIYVDFESQTAGLIDVWNFGKFINYKFVLIESEGEIWYFT